MPTEYNPYINYLTTYKWQDYTATITTDASSTSSTSSTVGITPGSLTSYVYNNANVEEIVDEIKLRGEKKLSYEEEILAEVRKEMEDEC